MIKFQLGVRLKDKITGFTGVAVGRAEYLTGCTQYGLCPPATDSKMNDNQWFDEGRLEYVDQGINEVDVRGSKNGGPNRDAPRF